MKHVSQQLSRHEFTLAGRKARRRGSTIVLMALSMTTLLGFGAVAVDYGLLVYDANRAQRSADAAALAGANELCRTGGCNYTSPPADTTLWNRIEYDKAQARYIAGKVAVENGLAVTASDIQLIPDIAGMPAKSVRVAAPVTRNLFFGRTLGSTSVSIARAARAGRQAVSGVAGAVPLAITTDDYYANKDGKSFELKLIRNQNDNFIPSTATALDLRPDNSGKSVDVFQEDLKFGYAGTIFLSQQINSALNAEIPSQGQKLEQAMGWRMDQAALAPYYDTGTNFNYPYYPVGDPRIITIIVADPNPANNNNPQITARFFVSVYIENVRSPGNQGVYIRMRLVPTRGYDSLDPRYVLGDENMPITGPSAVVLMN